MTTSAGPDFVSFQVRDIQASARFYEELVGMTPIPVPNPHAKAFSSGQGTFAVRVPVEGVDLDAVGPLGTGVAVWFASDDVDGTHRRLADAGVTIEQDPFDGPFGRTFTFRDPDGYAVTLHSA